MSDTRSDWQEDMDNIVDAAEETAQTVEDIASAVESEVEEMQTLDEAAKSGVEDAAEAAGTSEEKLEQVVGDAGNFMARDIAQVSEADESDRLWSLFAYLSQMVVPVVVPVLMLLLEPNKQRPFQKFHAVQSLGFLVAAFIYEILAGIVFAVLTAITLGCLGAILWILFLLPIVPAVYYAYLAYQGKQFDIPYLTKFMREQGWL